MNLTPDPVWPQVLLATALLVDALLSIRPPRFIRDCLNGVGFPQPWWWSLILIKTLGAVGLIAGSYVEGVGATTNIAVIAYFILAAIAHIKTRFVGSAFWLNCLGMLGLACASFVYSYLT